MEEIVEHNFESFDGSLLCNLYVPRRMIRERADWIRKILKTHDYAFLVSSSSDGISIVG